MFNDPLGWFPGPFFTNAFPILVFAVFFIDHLIPRLTIPKGKELAEKSDRGSYAVISIATLIAVLAGVAMRLLNIGTSSGLFQWLGVLVIIVGLAIREWALIKLGRFFSRTVQIETEHKSDYRRAISLDPSSCIYGHDINLCRYYYVYWHLAWGVVDF